MAVSYDILTLEISSEIVEKVRIWGMENIKITVAEFKMVYNLSKGDDYIFYITRQSKMNSRIIPLDITHKKVKQ